MSMLTCPTYFFGNVTQEKLQYEAPFSSLMQASIQAIIDVLEHYTVSTKSKKQKLTRSHNIDA